MTHGRIVARRRHRRPPTRSARRVLVAAAEGVGRRGVLGRRAGRLAGRVIGSSPLGRARLVRFARLLVAMAGATGSVEFGRGAVEGLAGARDRRLLTLAHELAVRTGDFPLAARVEARVQRDAPDEAAVLAADRMVELHRGDEALEALERLPATRAGVARRRVAALLDSGRFIDALRELDAMPAQSRGGSTAARFEALWAVGRRADAWAAFHEDASAVVAQRLLLELARNAGRQDGCDPIGALAARLESGELRAEPDELCHLWFTAGHLERLTAFAGDPDLMRSLGANGRFEVARALYVRRDFATAREVMWTLRGTSRQWDVDKLEARMLLEEGDFTAAVAARAGRRRFRPVIDEVDYFGRLLQGDLSAFDDYLDPDTRLRGQATFGRRFSAHPIRPVGHRFVVAQDGPGDEIIGAASITALSEMSKRLTVTCDPRLERLLRRSFTEVEFVASSRAGRFLPAGFAGADAPDRASGPLFRMLTVAAEARSDAADEVVLARGVLPLFRHRGPSFAYLRPDPALLRRFQWLQGSIGVVWRSELDDPIRRIHYLRAEDLAPLGGPGRRFVCLQHDVRDSERAELAAALGPDVTFLDDVDLRNDFDEAAAVAASCSAVVGPGTTFVELAAAVGTPTVYVHPTTYAQWRRGCDGADFWHASMRHAIAASYDEPASCVAAAADELIRLSGLA